MELRNIVFRLNEEEIEAAWNGYLAALNDERDSAGPDVWGAVESEPEDVWKVVARQLDRPMSDRSLGFVAIEVLQWLQSFGSPALWATIHEASDQLPNLRRMVAALDRYDAKYAEFFNRLHGNVQELTPLLPPDLPIPNPYDESSSEPDRRSSVAITPALKEGFLRQDSEICQDVLELESESPEDAWGLAIELVAEAPDEESLSWVGIGLIETLVSHHETQFAERVLTQVQSNARFRRALSSCYLNPSEPFLDRLLEAAVHQLVQPDSDRLNP